ncbi:MAG: c-type cytochrome [Paracoccaceae bacterium]
MLKTSVICALAAFALPGLALADETPPLFGDAPSAISQDRPDPQRGKAIAAGGSTGGGVDMKCMACHGLEGEGAAIGGIPRLAGLPYEYLRDQLDAFINGDRSSAIMAPIALRLQDDERDSVASYYASLATDDGPTGPFDPALVQRGGALAATGERPDASPVTACSSCHVDGSAAAGSDIPQLDGQHASYIEAQLVAWQNGVRRSDALDVMKDIAMQLSAEDIEAVAAYYASLHP